MEKGKGKFVEKFANYDELLKKSREPGPRSFKTKYGLHVAICPDGSAAV